MIQDKIKIYALLCALALAVPLHMGAIEKKKEDKPSNQWLRNGLIGLGVAGAVVAVGYIYAKYNPKDKNTLTLLKELQPKAVSVFIKSSLPSMIRTSKIKVCIKTLRSYTVKSKLFSIVWTYFLRDFKEALDADTE